MLPFVALGDKGSTFVMLHWLGGSARTWTEVCDGLSARGYRTLALDLPGFGEAVANPHHTVESMAEQVLDTLSTLQPADPHTGWLLVGHSMGGKVAALVARSLAESNTVPGLRGLILVSPSPPSAEPMPGSKRSQLLKDLGQSTGDIEQDRKLAGRFIDDNTGDFPLAPAIHSRSSDDILRMDRGAFRDWLNHGSQEDCAVRVGTLDLPALVFAGTEDAALGPDAQRQHTLIHLPAGRLVTLPRAGHLAPLERAQELVARFSDFAIDLGLPPHVSVAPASPAFRALLNSDHTSAQTRAVLEARLVDDDTSTASTSLSDLQRHALLALTDCVIPSPPFDLANLLERTLTAGQGDGWRFDALPSDARSLRLGLTSLNAAANREHGVDFIALPTELQRTLLQQAQSGHLGCGLLATLGFTDIPDLFTAKQMQLWFEDIRSTLTRLYVADPRTLDRIGFSGFADDQGFTQIQPDQREAFETSPSATEPTA